MSNICWYQLMLANNGGWHVAAVSYALSFLAISEYCQLLCVQTPVLLEASTRNKNHSLGIGAYTRCQSEQVLIMAQAGCGA